MNTFFSMSMRWEWNRVICFQTDVKGGGCGGYHDAPGNLPSQAQPIEICFWAQGNPRLPQRKPCSITNLATRSRVVPMFYAYTVAASELPGGLETRAAAAHLAFLQEGGRRALQPPPGAVGSGWGFGGLFCSVSQVFWKAPWVSAFSASSSNSSIKLSYSHAR